MKKLLLILSLLFAFLSGILITQIPDLISIYADHTIGQYQKSECADKGKGPNDCYFDDYFDKYQKENPFLDNLHSYFLLSEGTLYWVLTKRCTEDIFYNPSATKDSGKITNREYFETNCWTFRNDLSDLIWGKK
jgi:hypothetical protein